MDTRKIAAIYKAGGWDNEAAAELAATEAGFKPLDFASWYAERLEFRELIDNCRILARAYWDKAIAEGARLVPDWYYSPPSDAVRELIALACQAAECCPIGSAEREREFKNVERLLRAVSKS